jgi:hypothetical protein
MKTTPLFLLVTAALFGCSKPASQTAVETPAVSPPEPEPPAAVAPAVAVATPVPDPLAPAGVYFLIAPASVTTDDGIIGLKPGTRLAAKAPGEYTDAAGHLLHLRPDQVTNNLRIATMAAEADANAQAVLRQAIASAATPVPASPAVATPAPISRASSPQTGNSSAAPASTPAGAANSPFAATRLGATQVPPGRTLKVDSRGTYWMDDRGVNHYVK